MDAVVLRSANLAIFSVVKEILQMAFLLWFL